MVVSDGYSALRAGRGACLCCEISRLVFAGDCIILVLSWRHVSRAFLSVSYPRRRECAALDSRSSGALGFVGRVSKASTCAYSCAMASACGTALFPLSCTGQVQDQVQVRVLGTGKTFSRKARNAYACQCGNFLRAGLGLHTQHVLAEV